MKYFAPIIALALLASSAFGQIEMVKEAERDTLITAVLTNTIPEGAYLADGGWSIDKDASTYLDSNGKTFVFAAAPGEYTVEYDGILLQDVTFTDGAGNPVTIRSYVGRIKEKATCKITGGTEPDPPNPPDPPTPGGPWQIMMFYSADQLDNLPEPQRQLLTSLKVRQKLKADGHVLLEVLEASNLSGSLPAAYAPWVNAVSGDPLPRIAIAPKMGGKVTDFPLPANADLLYALLAEGGE